MSRTPRKHPIDLRIGKIHMRTETVFGGLIVCLMIALITVGVIMVVWGMALNSPEILRSTVAYHLEQVGPE